MKYGDRGGTVRFSRQNQPSPTLFSSTSFTSLPPLLCSSLFPYLLRLFLSILLVQSANAQGAFFRSLLSVPDQCYHRGITATCQFIVSCIIEGGSPYNTCGGGYIFACCVRSAATVRSDVGANIRAFNFFAGSPRLETPVPRPKLRFFENRAPPLSHSGIYFRSHYNPVKVGPSFSNNIPLSYAYPKREIQSPNRIPTIFYNPPECGIQRMRQFSKRIIGGDEAKFAELPWQAHIRIAGYQCGGVLINNLFVATAAHCVHKARLSQITVYLGEYDTKDTGDYIEPLPKQTFAVIEKRTHPRFKYMLTQPDRYDVAVLRLSHPATFQDNVIPICLPDPSDDFQGAVGIVAGWGKTDTSFGKTGTNILRKVIVPVIDNKECLKWYHRKGIDVKLHFDMFCAGHSQGKMDACLGDSGGPLVVLHGGRWRLAGITSAGFGCAVDHQPGIYHKVTVTSGWIAANVRH